jgi:hypothetical protein
VEGGGRGENDVLLALCLEDHGSLLGSLQVRLLEACRLAEQEKRIQFGEEKLTRNHNSQKKRWRKSSHK